MIHITSLDDGLETFKALGSDTRIQILNILLENEQMSMNQLATELNISNGALTGHIKKLEECGLINISNESAGHGNQKMCSVTQDRIIVDIKKPIDYKNVFETEIKVGQFSRHQVWPTCGIATSESVIGEFDDIRYFNHPDRFTANILWFTKGYVEYTIPNLIPSNQRITQLSISAELSSEAPGIDNNWPSDISFYINDTKIGMWTSPGDFGDVHGMFTPQWWPQNWNQYGLLKLLVTSTVLRSPMSARSRFTWTTTATSACVSRSKMTPSMSAASRSMGNLSETTIRTSVSPSIMRRLSLRSRSGGFLPGSCIDRH